MHFRCFFGLFCAVWFFGVYFCRVLLVRYCCLSLFGTFVFETSCIFGVSLVCFVLLFSFFFVVSCLYILLFRSFCDFCF